MQLRLNHGWSYDALGGAFLCSRQSAQSAKRRIQLFLLMWDPLHSLPTILNNDTLTDDQVRMLIFLPLSISFTA